MTDITLTADCIKSVSNIGSTTYMNICTGASSVVPWGTVDVVAPCIIVGLMLLVVGAVMFSNR